MERQRNRYAANCCVCMELVEAEQGWLYCDVRKARRCNGRLPKKVKCDRCHSGKPTLEKTASIPKWSITDVRKWDLQSEIKTLPVAGAWNGTGYEWTILPITFVIVTIDGEKYELTGQGFLGRQVGLDCDWEYNGLAGKTFTPAAWKLLVDRVQSLMKCNSAAV